MRRVKERDALALQCQRDPDLLGEGIVPRGLGDRPEILPQRGERLAVFRTAQHDELGLAIESRKVPQQVPDVCADAEVVQLAGIYADPHVGMISGQGGQDGQGRQEWQEGKNEEH